MWSSSCGGPTPPLSLLVLAPGVNQLTSHKPSFIILAMRRAIVFEDRVYVLGGFDGTSRLRSVECFTPGPPGSRPRWHQVGSFEVNSPGRPGCQGGRHVGTSLQLLRGHPQWSSCRDGRLQARLQKKSLNCDHHGQDELGRQEAGEVEGSVCNMVDVYCPSSNKFVPILSFGQDVKMARS